MTTALYILGAASAVLGIIARVFSAGGNRDVSLWVSCVAINLIVVAGFVWYQDRQWQKDSKERARTEEADNATRMARAQADEREAVRQRDTAEADARARAEAKRLEDGIEAARKEAEAAKKGLENLPTISGPLTPGNKPPPKGRRQIKDAMNVYLGSNHLFSKVAPFHVLSEDGRSILSINLKPDGVFISARFFNSEGKLLCKVDDNKVTRQLNTTSDLDLSDPHRFMLTDDADNQVLEIEYLNPFAMQVKGDFFGCHGGRLIIDDETVHWGNMKMSRNVNEGGYAIVGSQLFQVPPNDKGQVPTISPEIMQAMLGKSDLPALAKENGKVKRQIPEEEAKSHPEAAAPPVTEERESP